MSSDYEVIHLGASLRSTCRIAKFADSWIHAKHLGNFEFSCNPAHNFEGENLDIKFVKEGGTNLEQDEQQFVQQCVNFICEHAEKWRGLEVLPVVPLLDCKSKEMVKQKLLEQSFTCFSPSFRAHGSNQNIPRQDSAKISSNDLPVISFFNGSIIEGAEFGTVLILVRLKEPSQVPAGLGQQFFTAITRASTRVAIIVGEIKSTEDFQKNCTESNLNEKFEEILRIVRQRRESKPSIVIVGANSSIPGFRNESRSSTPIPEVDGVSLHVDNQTCFLHMDDLYKQSDLVKLQEFGIRLVILFNENATCPWQFLFYYSSLKCIKRFINETGNSFRLFNLTDLNEDKIDEIVCLAGFCAEQSGLPGATQPDLSRQHKRYDSPAPESSIFSWDKWKAKGTEHYNRGQKIFAADNYVQSLVLLERQYYSHIAAPSDFNAAVQARQELAKLCTNVATMYIQHHENPSHEQQEIYDRFRLDFELGATFESCINTAFRHAMRAIEWNAGWRKGFAKVSEITSKIEQYYSEKKLSIQNSSDTALQEILSEKEIRKTDQCFVRFRQDVTFPLPNFSQTSLDATIETYKDQSETAKLENLISLRKKISELCAKSASESFTLIKSRVTASNAVNFIDLLQIGCEARQLFEYPIQIAMESLYWNPFQPEAYDEISRSLDRLKDITGSLKDKANILSQDIYLKQYTECEIQDYNQ